jgi:hypothetical protein
LSPVIKLVSFASEARDAGLLTHHRARQQCFQASRQGTEVSFSHVAAMGSASSFSLKRGAMTPPGMMGFGAAPPAGND